jgi:Uma2 family endonuclease
MTLETRTDDNTPRPAKLTAKDFWLLADSGAFDHHARTELIEGEIWVVNSVHRWHARVMGELFFRLRLAIEAADLDLEVYVAGSVSMSNDSVPEPDISIIAPLHEAADTIEREELKIAVEITDTTVNYDLGLKARLYARHGIPEYWVVHRDGGVVIQMWSPADDGYAERREIPFGSRIAAATIDALVVETNGIN